MQAIIDTLVAFATWLKDLVLWVPRKVWEMFLDGAAAVVAAIPVPDAFSSFQGSAAALSGGVVWFFDLLAIKQGLAIILGAYVARFLLRRIPGIG